MMSRKRFYYLSLLLPIILPLLFIRSCLIIEYARIVDFRPIVMDGCIDSSLVFVFYIIGSIAYGIMAIGIAIWMRNKPAFRISNAMWKWPLLTLIFSIPPSLIALGSILLREVFYLENFAMYLGAYTMLIGSGIIYGYMCVCLVKVLEWVLTKCLQQSEGGNALNACNPEG